MSVEKLTIKQLDSRNADRWDAFVRQSRQGTFYHLAAWRTLIESVLRHDTYYMYCEKDGEMLAVLPLARVKSWLFGDALVSTPFLVYGGPISVDDDALAAIVEAARDLAENLDVDYLELRNREPLQGEWHTNNTNVTFRRRIESDSDANMLAIPRKQRAMIRKGIKFGLQAELDEDADRLHAAMLACKRNLGTPFFGRRWLQAIKEEFGEHAEILTVTRDNNVVCSVMSFRFEGEVLPYYGGGGDLARDLKGNDFMYWSVMDRAATQGAEVFDYGRSKIGTGAYSFKKHWGFEPEPLYYQYHLVRAREVPNISPVNPRFELMVSAWKRLPLAVAGLIGPALARRLA